MKRETQTLFTANNPVAVAQEFQYIIEFEQDKDIKRQKAVDALEIIGDPKEIYGSSVLLVHALKAFVYYNPQMADFDSSIYHGTEFDNLVARANFRFGFTESAKLGSLCLLLYDAKILNCEQKEFNGERINSGVIVPVMDVESVWPAK